MTTLPPGRAGKIRAWLESGAPPAPARDAATVALVRDGTAGLEVYLLRRVREMAFAAGMFVFPGGSVDDADRGGGADRDPAGGDATGWAATGGDATGWDAAGWAAAFGVDEALARALVCAAVRETFEESGVLLAGRSATEVLPDVSDAGWEAERVALEAREQSLSGLLLRRGLVLRADLLAPLAHWITPDSEPRRFDTRFFLAAVPPGQVCREVGGEADERRWVAPAAALAGGLRMMPPTRAVLADLARFGDVASALAAEREIRVVHPRFVLDGDEVRLER